MAPAAEVTAWQIGQFDQSSEELGSSFGIRKVSMGRAMLDINGQHYTGSLFPTSDFGEQLVKFEVPEWSGSAKGRLRVEARGMDHFDVTLEPQRKWTVFVVPHTLSTWGISTTRAKWPRDNLASSPRLLILFGKTPTSVSRWTVRAILALAAAGRQPFERRGR